MPDIVIENSKTVPRVGFGSELFWRLLATAIFISVLWILWLLWQITPKSTVNPIVFQIQQNRQSASGHIRGAPDGAQTGDSSKASELPAGVALDNLKVETELKLPPEPSESSAK